MYRWGEDWYCTFTVEYDAETGDETEIGVDIGHNHLLAAEAENGELMLVSGREAKYVRRKYRSLRESLQQAGALRACNRVGDRTAAADAGRESVPHRRGNAQPEYSLRGIPPF